MTKSFIVAAALAAALAIQGCAGGAGSRPEGQSSPAAIPEIARTAPKGYLASDAVPDSLALLPTPRIEGSAAFALDEVVSRRSLALRETPRGVLATEDANLKFPNAAGTFSCALNAPITEQDTPHLYKLMQRSLVDAIRSTSSAKTHYLRPRPYLVNKVPPCAEIEDRADLPAFSGPDVT